MEVDHSSLRNPIYAFKGFLASAIDQISQSVSSPISDSLYREGKATPYARLRDVFGIKTLIVFCSIPVLALIYKLRTDKHERIALESTASIGYATMAYKYIQSGWMEKEEEAAHQNQSVCAVNDD